MTLAGFTRRVVCCFSLLTALPVSPALLSPLVFAAIGLPVVVLRFPLSPVPCFFPALLAAVARKRMNGTKSTLASLQQTSSGARTSHSPRLPCGFVLVNLIFFGSWTIFTRAHGRCLLPEAQASKGRLPSSSGRLCVGTGTPLLYLKAKSASKTGSPGLQVLHRSHHYLGVGQI